jgi:hypothetical protein
MKKKNGRPLSGHRLCAWTHQSAAENDDDWKEGTIIHKQITAG